MKDKPFDLSQAALDAGTTGFVGLVRDGMLAHWLVSVDKYTDTRGWGKRKKTTTLFDIHLAPTSEVISGATIELDEGDAVRESLEEVFEFLDPYDIRWLDTGEAQEALGSMKDAE